MTGDFLQGADRGAVRETIDRILARTEFRPAGRGFGDWLGEKLEAFARWFKDLFGIADVGTARTMVTTFLILAAVAAVWAVARVFLLRGGTGPRSHAIAEGPALDTRHASVAALRREAREASARGEHLAALRLTFRALVVGLSERGDLAYRDAWTNRELLERGAPRREVLPLLGPLVPRLDAQSFGREPAGPEDVARLDALCDRLLPGS